jgi:hypothetical protein
MKPISSHAVQCSRAALGTVLMVSIAGSARAQRPGWAAQYAPDLGDLPTPAERAAMMATADEIMRILWRQPGLAQSQGFAVRTQVYGGTLPLGERGVLAFNVFLWFFAPSQAREGRQCIAVTVNQTGGSSLVDEAGRGIFVEQEIGDPKPSATIVHEGLRWDTPTADRRPGYVTFTSRGAFPWIHLTREEYQRALIHEADGKPGDSEASMRKTLEKTTYERWMEEAAARKKTREETIATMERLQGRAAADELRKTLEQTERDVTEQYKADEAEERKRNRELLATPTQADRLRGQLAAMSPSERAAPAFVDAYGPLVASDHPRARRVLRADPEFWRVRRSRAEVHSITVGFQASLTCGVPAVRAALEKTYETLDWAAFRQMVDRPYQ